MGGYPANDEMRASTRIVVGAGIAVVIVLIVGLGVMNWPAKGASDVGEDGNATATSRPITTAIRDSAGIKLVILNQGLDFRTAAPPAVKLKASARVGGVDRGFGLIADVAALRGGSFAVLDRSEYKVIIYSPDGREVRRFGKKGNGPGEFYDPFSIEAVGSLLVIREAHPIFPWMVFDTSGALVVARKRDVPGDWGTHFTRQLIPRMSDPPYRMPAEDVTRRLFSLSDSTFAYVLQEPERFPPGVDTPIAFLLAFHPTRGLVDTVDLSKAPVDVGGLLKKRNLAQKLYVGRPLWAAGKNWIAHGHGDSTRITVRSQSGVPLLIIELPGERQPIRPTDKEVFADWYFEEDVLKHGTAEVADQAKRLSRKERRDYANQITGLLQWASNAPYVTALYGDSECLWLGGFSPSEYPDGTALTWIAVNVTTGRATAYRLPRRGGRVREIGYGSIYTTYYDEDGTPVLEKYDVQCT